MAANGGHSAPELAVRTVLTNHRRDQRTRTGGHQRTNVHWLDPAIMGPPIVWLASRQASGTHDERIVASEFESWRSKR